MREYGLVFPVLADVDGAVSRQYTGVDGADVTVPGVVVVRGGRIAYRRVSTSKDDRPTTRELVASIDRALGTHGTGVRGGYAVLERLQLRLDLGGAAPGGRATANATAAVLYPLHRYVIAGPWLRGEFRDGRTDLDAAVGLRLPLIADRGAIQLVTAGGWTVAESRGANASAQIGAWVALTPTLALQLDAGFAAHRLDHDPVGEVFVTFGISRLVRAR